MGAIWKRIPRFYTGKSAGEIVDRPYRKPTQVDEMNILRRSSDLSLRN